MKKVLYFTFAVLVLSVMCFSVMPARADVTFNGEYRVRGFAYDIDGSDDSTGNRSDSQSFWDQRFRLYITAQMSDNLKGVIRMLAPHHNPCDLGGGTYPGNVWGDVWEKPVLWDLAYMDFDVPELQLNAKVGRQGIDLGNKIVLGSCKTYDSLILTKMVQNMTLSVLTAKFYEGDKGATATGFDDEDIYGAVLNFAAAPNVNMGVWAVMGKDGDTVNGGYMFDDATLTTNPTADAFWFGATAAMDYSPLKINLEFDYSKITLNGINANPDFEMTGYAFFADVSTDIGVAKVGGNLLYTTGDDKADGDATKSDLFVPISSHFSERNDYDELVVRRYLYGNGNGLLDGDRSIGNILAIQLYATKDLTPKLSGKASIQNYSFNQDPDGDGPANPMDKAIGQEIDVKLAYKVNNNLTVTGTGAYWITTDDIFGTDNENCWFLKHEILYKF
ncbi:MAG: hypothetical protein ACMUIS_01285 [bacterium]